MTITLFRIRPLSRGISNYTECARLPADSRLRLRYGIWHIHERLASRPAWEGRELGRDEQICVIDSAECSGRCLGVMAVAMDLFLLIWTEKETIKADMADRDERKVRANRALTGGRGRRRENTTCPHWLTMVAFWTAAFVLLLAIAIYLFIFFHFIFFASLVVSVLVYERKKTPG